MEGGGRREWHLVAPPSAPPLTPSAYTRVPSPLLRPTLGPSPSSPGSREKQNSRSPISGSQVRHQSRGPGNKGQRS